MHIRIMFFFQNIDLIYRKRMVYFEILLKEIRN